MIVSNRARCRKCNTVIESVSRHDFCFCNCGSIFVDGGHDYLRRGGDLENFEDLSVVEESKPEDVKASKKP